MKCRLERSGHSDVVVFHGDDGEEFFVLPAERLDPATLEKLRDSKVRCAVGGPVEDGTAALSMHGEEGELLFEQNVWIRAAALGRLFQS
ncbi:MAG: hypothetical protein ABI592_04565 [Acidobacteriota bacterium]